MSSFILSKTAQFLLPLTLLFSLYMLLRGHDAPGGGFIAGLVTTLALVVEAFASGAARARRRLRRVVRVTLWAGLALAAAAAAAPLLAGEPLLTHHHLRLPLPGGTGLALSTTLLFDLGVYAAVTGAVGSSLGSLAGGPGP